MYTLFSKMPLEHQEIAKRTGYLERLKDIETKVLANEQIVSSMADFAIDHYNVCESELKLANPISNRLVIDVLHQFVRDWCPETVRQRDELFKPILSRLDDEFPVSDSEAEQLANSAQSMIGNIHSETCEVNTEPLNIPKTRRSSFRVLVPGSGLGRLAYEISRMGFQTEALDCLGVMDIAANFLFKFPKRPQFVNDNNSSSTHFDLYPYIHHFSHQVARKSQTRPCTIPEFEFPEYLKSKYKVLSTVETTESTVENNLRTKSPTTSPSHQTLRIPSTLSLEYGDFTKLSQNNGTTSKSYCNDRPNFADETCSTGRYNAIVTLYLIDTAENALVYLDTIRKLLKPNGIWINYGPLKWGTAPQVEFNLEELEIAIRQMGFQIESKWKGENEYNGDTESLWRGTYDIRGWMARKCGNAGE